MSFSLSNAGVRGILLDIEGTTTPIAFVYDVLFPFARLHIEDYLSKHPGEVEDDLALLAAEHADDMGKQSSPPPLAHEPAEARVASLVAYIHWLMDRDRKSTGLKSLQGKVWRQGYRDGAIKSQVFADVPAAMNRWKAAGLPVSIFSSGSVLAQQLLFGHTESGDLAGFLHRYFDTSTGSKSDPRSYTAISGAIGFDPSAIVFLSDVVKELDAAAAAGIKTLLCVRPGNHPQPPSSHKIIENFEQITD